MNVFTACVMHCLLEKKKFYYILIKNAIIKKGYCFLGLTIIWGGDGKIYLSWPEIIVEISMMPDEKFYARR